MTRYKLIDTKDGSKSLFFPELNETYHSKFGAKTESEHVFLQSGYRYLSQNDLSILEIGLGTGLNVFLTYLHHLNDKKRIYYEALEKYPLSMEITAALNYAETQEEKEIFDKIHHLEWNLPKQIGEGFVLHKNEVDLLAYQTDKKFDLIYFDAFAPDKQPDMWTEQIFSKLYDMMNKQGVLVTYSAKGSVRRTMQSVGFEVERIQGPPGKREMLRARKVES